MIYTELDACFVAPPPFVLFDLHFQLDSYWIVVYHFMSNIGG